MTNLQLKAWRVLMDLSQEGAAELLGVSKTTYQSWERGRTFREGRPLEVQKTVEYACKWLAYEQGVKL